MSKETFHRTVVRQVDQSTPVVLGDEDLALATGAATTKLQESAGNGHVFKAETKVIFRFYRPSHGHGE